MAVMVRPKMKTDFHTFSSSSSSCQSSITTTATEDELQQNPVTDDGCNLSQQSISHVIRPSSSSEYRNYNTNLTWFCDSSQFVKDMNVHPNNIKIENNSDIEVRNIKNQQQAYNQYFHNDKLMTNNKSTFCESQMYRPTTPRSITATNDVLCFSREGINVGQQKPTCISSYISKMCFSSYSDDNMNKHHRWRSRCGCSCFKSEQHLCTEAKVFPTESSDPISETPKNPSLLHKDMVKLSFPTVMTLALLLFLSLISQIFVSGACMRLLFFPQSLLIVFLVILLSPFHFQETLLVIIKKCSGNYNIRAEKNHPLFLDNVIYLNFVIWCHLD